jgi:DNA ligase (NAD+)
MRDKWWYAEAISNLWKASAAYYNDDNPILTDAEYDALYKAVQEYEAETGNINPNSPTQRVGGSVCNSFEKVQHPRHMGSLNNVFSEEEIAAFKERTNTAGMIVEPKLDGLTLVCHYNKGEFVRAVTRGDGVYGEDVTESARTIRNLPLNIPYEEEFWIRGEVIMRKDDFNKLNEALTQEGKQPFANPRNAAAGSLRQKDPKKAYERALYVYFYDCGMSEPQTEVMKLQAMHDAGLPVVTCSPVFDSVSAVYQACEDMAAKRDMLNFDIDGAVIKCLFIAEHKRLGEGTKCPNWAVAYKFKAEHVCSCLKDVEWQVGRTGQVTPVAVLDKVNIGGSIVDHASLHNVDYIKTMGLKLNDEVSIYKAAEIIPQVGKVLFHRDNSREIEVPTHCPVCGTMLIRDGAALMCTNKNCSQKIKAWIEFFGARDHMDIQGLGTVVVSALVNSGLVKTPADLYTLKKEHLLLLPGFGERKATLLIEAIEESKKKPYAKVLASLGVDMLGDTTSKELARRFSSIDELRSASEESLLCMEGYGQKTVEAIKLGLNDPDMVKLTSQLTELGLNTSQEPEESIAGANTLEGVSICITGTLSKERSYFQELIEAHGGKFASGVTSKTNFLLAGDGGGSKRKKAESLGIPVITEETFERMINGNGK